MVVEEWGGERERGEGTRYKYPLLMRKAGSISYAATIQSSSHNPIFQKCCEGWKCSKSFEVSHAYSYTIWATTKQDASQRHPHGHQSSPIVSLVDTTASAEKPKRIQSAADHLHISQLSLSGSPFGLLLKGSSSDFSGIVNVLANA